MAETLGTQLKEIIEASFGELAKLTNEQTSIRPAPGKWSPKEIIGHLIDSASNNHQRFVRAQFTDDLIFPGYAQNEWVTLQGYNEAHWMDLLNLWKSFNLHLAYYIDQIPDDVLTKERYRHNLHQIAWQTVPENQSTNLYYFIHDYIGHLEHHLGGVI